MIVTSSENRDIHIWSIYNREVRKIRFRTQDEVLVVLSTYREGKLITRERDLSW